MTMVTIALWLFNTGLGDGTVVYRGGTAENPIFVIDEGDLRRLRFGDANGDDQTAISRTQPGEVPTEYVRDALVGVALTPALNRVLMIGLGGGSFSTRLRQSLPRLLIDVVEIDPEVVSIANRFFSIRADDRLRIHVADGDAYLQTTTERYDLILVDAYSGSGIPNHLMVRPFIDRVQAHLSERGVAVFNIALIQEQEERDLVRTLRKSFRSLLCLHTTIDDNLLVFALTTEPPSRAQLATALKQRAQTMALPWNLAAAERRIELPCERWPSP